MAAKAYYSEFDPHAAQWLRNLIAAGVIAPGVVDERDIRDVNPDDLKDFTQCHFFAGIGVWSYALRQAGWDDSRPVFTGSCPCPPFSAAGKKKSCPRCGSRNILPHVGRTGVFVCCDCGHDWPADDRHLWPEFWRLIESRRPSIVFGEQVASPDGVKWLALVRASLEIVGYAVRGGDVPACSVGAPQIRQRLFFVADSGRCLHERGRRPDEASRTTRPLAGEAPERERRGVAAGASGTSSVVADASSERRDRLDALLRGEKGEWGAADILEAPWRGTDGLLAGAEGERLQRRPDDGDEGRRQRTSGQGCEAGELGDADEPGLEGRDLPERGRSDECASRTPSGLVRPGPTNGFWRDADWIFCTDGKWRPAQPLPQQMVDGLAADLGCVRADQDTGFPLIGREAFGAGGVFEGKSRAKMLKGYGNAIVGPLATEFIKAAMECMP